MRLAQKGNPAKSPHTIGNEQAPVTLKRISGGVGDKKMAGRTSWRGHHRTTGVLYADESYDQCKENERGIRKN